jgi:FtsP/CotA-like multicopper oxidase with cupredoxin domain
MRVSISRRNFLKTAALVGGSLLLPSALVACVTKSAPPAAPPPVKRRVREVPAAFSPEPPRLDLKPFVDALPVPGSYTPDATRYPGTDYYEIEMVELEQKVHADLPATPCWGYGPATKVFGGFSASWPAGTIVATRNRPVKVKWANNLPDRHLLDPAIDTSIMPGTREVTAVTHVHGGEQPSASDGHPMAAYGVGKSAVFDYPNAQRGATIWYHDHALGATRLNVYAGLAGFYLIVDPAEEKRIAADPAFGVPQAPYDIGLAIQDRDFNTDGTLWYPTVSDNPDIHPHWVPEFFGSKVLVNGKVWPYLDVEPRRYRFRVLNGSQARFYNLSLSTGSEFQQISSDGGYLPAPVSMKSLLIAPGERCDIVIDFSSVPLGTKITLKNDANAPYPDGDPVDPETTGRVMEFRVSKELDGKVANKPLPAQLAEIPALPALSGIPVRSLFLNEVATDKGPTSVRLDNTPFDAEATEMPRVGSTEIWEIANTTGDTHPIHLHLVQFRVLDRQKFNAEKYAKVALAGKGAPYPSVKRYLSGKPRKPEPNEMGWKDTVKMHPEEVTRILVRFAPQDAPATVKAGENAYPFDPTLSSEGHPGYVWHCHILEHEENDMMRPLVVKA